MYLHAQSQILHSGWQSPFHSVPFASLSGNPISIPPPTPEEPKPIPIVHQTIFHLIWQRIKHNFEIYLLITIIVVISIVVYVLIPNSIIISTEIPSFYELRKGIEYNISYMRHKSDIHNIRLVHSFHIFNDTRQIYLYKQYNKQWDCEGATTSPESVFLTEVLYDGEQKICHEVTMNYGVKQFDNYSWIQDGNRYVFQIPVGLLTFDEILTVKQSMKVQSIAIDCTKLDCLLSLFGINKLNK